MPPPLLTPQAILDVPTYESMLPDEQLEVSLFGLTTDPCQPFHYYGSPKEKCTHEIPAENDESIHWFEKEHAIYDELQRKGALTVRTPFGLCCALHARAWISAQLMLYGC